MAETKDFLDEMLDQQSSEAQEPQQETPETQEPAAEPTPETGATATPEATPATEPPKEEHVPYQAMKAEREKRQEAQRKAEELEARLKQIEAAQQQPQPQFYEDPDGYINARLQQAQQQFQQRFIAAMEADARAQHEDYDEAIGYLREKANPALIQQVFQSPNPAREAYSLAKRMQAFEQMGDPEAYRQKLEAEIRQKVEAELLAKEKSKQDALARIPPDLSNGRSSGAPSAATPPEDFSDLFPKR